MVGGFIIFVVICHLRGLFQRLLSWVSNEFFRNYSRGPRAHRIGLCRFGIFLLNLLKIVWFNSFLATRNIHCRGEGFILWRFLLCLLCLWGRYHCRCRYRCLSFLPLRFLKLTTLTPTCTPTCSTYTTTSSSSFWSLYCAITSQLTSTTASSPFTLCSWYYTTLPTASPRRWCTLSWCGTSLDLLFKIVQFFPVTILNPLELLVDILFHLILGILESIFQVKSKWSNSLSCWLDWALFSWYNIHFRSNTKFL